MAIINISTGERLTEKGTLEQRLIGGEKSLQISEVTWPR